MSRRLTFNEILKMLDLVGAAEKNPMVHGGMPGRSVSAQAVVAAVAALDAENERRHAELCTVLREIQNGRGQQ